ncbi:hypothetical protein OAQ01_03995 [Emcibacteraceae bacterium]|nr:hypothetical protein [Emcibacteraceae bacterium]
MTKPRSLLKAAAIAYPLSHIGSVSAKAKASYQSPTTFKRDYYKELGVTPFINAAGAIQPMAVPVCAPKSLKLSATAPIIKQK